MMQIVGDIHQRNDDTRSFSLCSENSKAVTNTLTSLLQYQPLPSSQQLHAVDSSTFSGILRPQSFENPFDDPVLEPLPLKSLGVSKPHECFSLGIQPSNNVHAEHNVTINIEPIDIFSGENSSPFQANHHQDTSNNAAEESVARFRPFQDEKWKTSFLKLLQFKHEFGHCCVPHSYKEDLALARWVKRQRHQYKKFKDNDPSSTLTTSRLEQLEAIGFVWHSHAAAWMEKLNELKAFRSKKGHCNVPSTFPENPALSTWVKSQRRQYKLYTSGSPSTMTVLRFRILKSLGFVFEPRHGTSKNAGLELQG